MYYHSYFKLINGRGQYLLPYKFNGKELDRMHGLNWYDHGARMSDLALGRWHVVDALCEKYPEMSPYVMCHDNPINRIDLDGRDDYKVNKDGYIYESTSFWDKLKNWAGFSNNQDRLFLEETGKMIATFSEGTIIIKSNGKDASTVEIHDDKSADKFSDAVMKNTDVEWARIKHGDKNGSINTIQNNHNDRNVNSASLTIENAINKGETIFLFDHSHPIPKEYNNPDSNTMGILNLKVSQDDMQCVAKYRPKVSRVFNLKDNIIEYYDSKEVYKRKAWK